MCNTYYVKIQTHIQGKFNVALTCSGGTDKNAHRINENTDSMNIKSMPKAGKCCRLFALLLHRIQGDFTVT
jgi:hypothetical protein